MNQILQVTLLLLSIKVLKCTNSDNHNQKSGVCDRSLLSHRLQFSDIESILFSRTHNLSLRVSGDDNSAVINGELELLDALDEINSTTTIIGTTTTDGGANTTRNRNQGSAKTNFKEDDRNQSASALDHSDDTTTSTTLLMENQFMQTLNERLQRLMTPFLATKGQKQSSACQLHTQLFLEHLNTMELWALKMLDANAKVPSGILSGNLNQYGDFDECLSVDGPNNAFQGQYCLAYIQPSVTEDYQRLSHLVKLIQSHNLFKSRFEDPGHRVPRFSTINWGLCVPSSCSYQEIEESLKEQLIPFIHGTGIDLRIKVDQDMCQVRQKNWMQELSFDTKVSGSIFLFIILFSLVAGIYDSAKEENKNEWITAFSIVKNTKSIFNFNRDPGDISSMHGIRFLNAFLLIISHKSMALFFNPYINRTAMSETVGQPWSVIARAASLYTDPFIMMSGLLTTYSLYGRLQRGQRINVINEYVGRFMRIAPPLGALIVFCTYILPLMGSGPAWNLVVSHHAGICKSYWWRNLMFIHNYFGFENMCLTHTHHIGIDTQLFFTAPLLVAILWKWPKRGTGVMVGIAVLSTIARHYVTVTRNLSNYVHFGTSITQLFDTANYMYIIPAYRATVYIMGVLLGYYLRLFKDTKLSSVQLKLGWCISTILIMGSFFGPAQMGSLGYKFNSTHAAYYAAYAPIGWCCFFAWIIFTSQLGYHSALSRFFSWRGFLITTRLSYAIYLTQFPIFFYNVGQTRSAEYHGFIRMTLNWNEYFWILFTSYVLTVLFESPFTNLKKLMFSTKPQRLSSKNDTKTSHKTPDLVELSKVNHNNNIILADLNSLKGQDTIEPFNFLKEKTS